MKSYDYESKSANRHRLFYIYADTTISWISFSYLLVMMILFCVFLQWLLYILSSFTSRFDRLLKSHRHNLRKNLILNIWLLDVKVSPIFCIHFHVTLLKRCLFKKNMEETFEKSTKRKSSYHIIFSSIFQILIFLLEIAIWKYAHRNCYSTITSRCFVLPSDFRII